MIVPIGDTYYFKFTTRNFSTGAPFTLAGTPVISVYEENNVTQITAGITLTADYDSVTGLNDVAIVASSANGYEVGKYYDAVITTGTVNSVSVVGEVVGHFRVGPAEDAGAGIPDVNVVSWLDTAAATPTTAGVPEVDVTHWNAIALATTNPLPNAAPDAAGGLPISDAGGLDLDTKLANTNEITAARMGALTDWIDGGRLDLILDELTTQGDTNETKLDTLTTNVATVDTVADGIQADLSNGTNGLGALLTAIQAVMTTQMTESYAADAVAPTPAQALFLIQQAITEFAISGTTKTIKKLDGTTTAATETLDDATSPTSITRAT